MKIILCCPQCGGEIFSHEEDGFRCEACGCISEPEEMSASCDEAFGHVRWVDADIESALLDAGLDPTEDLVAEVRCACENDHHFTDQMIAAGWETLADHISEIRRRQNE